VRFSSQHFISLFMSMLSRSVHVKAVIDGSHLTWSWRPQATCRSGRRHTGGYPGGSGAACTCAGSPRGREGADADVEAAERGVGVATPAGLGRRVSDSGARLPGCLAPVPP
jgi:hypothetical protein